MDTSIKINQSQGAMLEMIIHPIIHTAPELDESVALLYFCLQGVLSELSDRLERIKFKGNKPKTIVLSIAQFHALMFAVNNFQSNDPWINANLIDIADKMHRKYVNAPTYTYIGSAQAAHR